MKTIKILNLHLVNFKGAKNFTATFDGKNAIVSGANGSGKSTIADAFYWLLFGKNADGKKQFAVKTTDKDGNVIPKLEHFVTASMDVDGQRITITRALNEKWQKKRGQEESLIGNEESITWNGVPCSSTEYAAKLASLCPDEILKIVTNPFYFTSLKADAQRSILFTLAQDITDEDVAAKHPEYQQLVETLQTEGKTLAEFKRELTALKKNAKSQVETIPARMDEISKAMPQEESLGALDQERERLLQKVAQSNGDPTVALEKEIEDLKVAIHNERAEYNLETSRQALEMEKEYNLMTQAEQDAFKKAEAVGLEVLKQTTIINEAREQFATIKAKDLTIEPVCPTCGQLLTPETIREHQETFNAHKAQALKEQIDIANAAMAERKRLTAEVKKIEDERKRLYKASETQHAKIEQFRKDREVKPQSDLDRQLADAEERLAKMQSVASTIGNDGSLKGQLDDVCKRIADQQRRMDDQERIATLEGLYRDAQQALADYEEQDFQAANFAREKALMMQGKIYALFKVVKWRLFEQQLNGNIAEVCIPTIDGVPFADANHAAKVQAGLDIIATIAHCYDISAPIFIDNAESINTLPAINSQTIEMRVSEEQLTIQTK